MKLINKILNFFGIKLIKNSEYSELENEKIKLRNENNQYKKIIESKENDGLAPNDIVKYK